MAVLAYPRKHRPSEFPATVLLPHGWLGLDPDSAEADRLMPNGAPKPTAAVTTTAAASVGQSAPPTPDQPHAPATAAMGAATGAKAATAATASIATAGAAGANATSIANAAGAAGAATPAPENQPAPPPAGRPKNRPKKRWSFWRILKWSFWLILLLLLSIVGYFAWQEMHDAHYQAEFFHRIAAKARFQLADGPSNAIRFPQESPYDERLGYANLPNFLQRLNSREYQITQQARISPQMAELVDRGLFAPYPEKTRVGLEINDCRNEVMFKARFPERTYPDFAGVPPLLVQSLLFIENRELLDTNWPKRNPAVEWDRLGKAVLEQLIHSVAGGHKTAGGSTLATQIEKYRHSPEGRTSNIKDKLRQMVSASLRAYQASEDTTQARQRIVLDYLNTVPLSAKPGFGEVNGMGDGLWVWYGRDFADINPLLQARQVTPQMALAYKQALSLMIAQRRPSYYLGDPDNDLAELTDVHLRLLAKNNIISSQLRDAALAAKLTALPGLSRTARASSFVERKASNAVRANLAGMLGDNRLYNLDRLDLQVQSTLDQQAQEVVGKALRSLGQADTAKEAGLQGKGMLGNGDPAQVVYSVTLLEKGEQGNYLRIQTDNYDQPLDINDGAKLDLGSTAKLRTLITYLDIIATLHARYGEMEEEQLKAVVVDPQDKISRWAIDTFLAKKDEEVTLRDLLIAALERKYSGNPSEGFFTGGGMHYFGNFRPEDNGRILSVREGLRNSVNLVFVRLLRDVVHYYMFQTPGSSASLLQNADDPRRAQYLARFADREGKEFIHRFYAKYKGKTYDEALAVLLQNIHPTPSRLASIFRTIYPEAGIAQFDAFVRANLPSQNEVPLERWAKLYVQHAPENMSLADRGYLARIHPLELWVVGFLRTHPNPTLAQMVAASEKERQQTYAWLFATHRKHAQDKRIAGLLEVEGFLEIHRQWKKMGYPFDSLVPSYASALGASADRPAALAEMMGILLNHGVKKPTWKIGSLHFAAQTPYETRFGRKPVAGEQVLHPDVAQVVIEATREVVSQGTAKRVHGAFVRKDGTVLPVGGKTGTGDQRFDVYGAGGRLIESRFVNRSATFVFHIGDQFFGSITAYVRGPQAENYDFTSALPVQLLKTLAPALMQLVDPASGKSCRVDTP
jgi:membrane peptidoglycan carboxypeptidase